MKTLQFEAIKMAIKQDKDGYVLTLRMHPDEIPEELLRDCFGYRKSYCGHWSTDYDLAEAIANHLKRRADSPSGASAAWEEASRAHHENHGQDTRLRQTDIGRDLLVFCIK